MVVTFLLLDHFTERGTVPPPQLAAFGDTGSGRALPGHLGPTSWYGLDIKAKEERLAQD